VAAASGWHAGSHMNEIVDNTAMHRFEMAIEDAIAVAYYQEQDGRVVLLHTEVPQRFSGHVVGSRLAHAVFETLKACGRRVIAKCPFMASYATKNPEYLAMLDG
jgi:predicted GNAT family acetyltransferase